MTRQDHAPKESDKPDLVIDSRLSRFPVGAALRRAAERLILAFSDHPGLRLVSRRLLVAAPVVAFAPWIAYLLVKIAFLTQSSRPVSGTASEPGGYWPWLLHAIQGDLGTSLASGLPVGFELGLRIPVTLGLVLAALLVSAVVGGAFGCISAYYGGWIGRILDVVSVAGFALPVFWLGPVLVELFALRLGLLPAGVGDPSSPAGWIRAMVLPVMTLSFGGVAAVASLTREAMTDALNSEFVRMAWARGAPARSVIFHHALRVASVRIITGLGVLAQALLGGTVFVEYIYAAPGLGIPLVQSAERQDWPVVTSIVLLFALIVVFLNLALDLLYMRLDPRLRVR